MKEPADEDAPGTQRFPPAAARFPGGWGRARPWTLAGRGGVCYAPTTTQLDELLGCWVREGHAHPATELKPGVQRAGELVAKFFAPPSWPRRLVGTDTAHRAAALAVWIHPLPTPRPLLAVGGVGPQGTASLLVSEAIDGCTLSEAWESDERVRAVLPELLAAMHERGIHHGDLHSYNLLWEGKKLYLIDVTAVRRGLHLLFARRLAEVQWARLLVYLGDVEGVRHAFRDYASRRGWSESAWERVLAHAKRLMRSRSMPLPQAPLLP